MAGEQAGRRGKPVRKRQNPDLPQGNPASERRRGKGLIRGFFGSCIRLALRGTAWVSIRLAVVFLLVFGPWTLHYFNSLPPAAELMDDRSNGAVTLLDRNDEVFAWRGDQFGGLVSSKTVSPHLKNAILVAEDKRFFRHFGISLKGIAGAVFINLREGRSPFSGHGGSTITQQVAKRVFFPELRSFNRKVREVPMAMAMELRYGKDEILNIYLNRVYLGAGTFGFEAASQRYFGKSARNVDPSEAAMLAGLLKAPSRYAPTRNLEGARSRARLIIGMMEAEDYLSQAEATHARNNPASLSRAAARQAGGYFADWIVETGPSFLLKDTTEDVVIRTTFDNDIQDAAEAALTQVFAEKVRKGSRAEAAIVVMSSDGNVRAIVGGRSSGTPGVFNRATQAIRQTGSAFKPFVYAAALENGYRPTSRVQDSPLTVDVSGSGPWKPRNYEGRYLGLTTFSKALANSANAAAVRISETVGRQKVRDIAHGFGISGSLAQGPAVALGASESTLLEMTAAYAGFLNLGRSVAPRGIRGISLPGDPAALMESTATSGNRVISDMSARQLVQMLNEVIENGTGNRALLEHRPAAGKTGTTQGGRDAWFIGFTADYVAGVWMGYDDNTRLTGVTGGGLPADIWRETMARIHGDLPAKPLPMIEPKPERDRRDVLVAGSTSSSAPTTSILARFFDSLFGTDR